MHPRVNQIVGSCLTMKFTSLLLKQLLEMILSKGSGDVASFNTISFRQFQS